MNSCQRRYKKDLCPAVFFYFLTILELLSLVYAMIFAGGMTKTKVYDEHSMNMLIIGIANALCVKLFYECFRTMRESHEREVLPILRFTASVDEDIERQGAIAKRTGKDGQ